jgi:hypothetical protein
MKLKNIKELEELRVSLQEKKDPNKRCIAICSGTGCHLAGHCGERGAVRGACGCQPPLRSG